MRIIDADRAKDIIKRYLMPNDMGEVTVEQAERWLLEVVDKIPTFEFNQWIEVSKLKPRSCVDVLIYSPTYGRERGWLDPDGDWRYEWGSLDDVTHWMPLPEEPKGE